MGTCPNKNSAEWKNLVSSRGEDVAYYLWYKYEGEVPQGEANPTIQTNISVFNLPETELKTIHQNYVKMMERKREGKGLSYEEFLRSMMSLQVFKSKDTYVFGEWDSENNIFKGRFVSSPSIRELFTELDNLLSLTDFMASVPEDIGSMLVKKGMFKLNVNKDYNFKGEQMVKNLYFSNRELAERIFKKEVDRVDYSDVANFDKFFSYGKLVSQLKAQYEAGELDKIYTTLRELGIYDYNAYRLLRKMKEGKIDEQDKANIIQEIIKNLHLNKVSIDKTDLINNPKIYEQLNNDLNKTLATYLSKFGIKTELLEDIQDKLGIDSFAHVDILNKILYASEKNQDDYPQQAGKVIAYMMQHNPLVTEIMSNLRRLGRYKNLSKDEMFEALGDLIAEQLYKKSKTPVPQSILDKINILIDQFLSYLRGINLARVNRNIAYIADNVLIQNQSLITASVFKPGAVGKAVERINLEDALASDEFANSIVDVMANYFILTGSVTLAEQGTVYRPNENQVHDLDWVSGFSREESKRIFEGLFPDNVYVRNIYNKEDGYGTDTWLVPQPGYKIQNVVFEGAGKKVASYDIVDAEGKIVSQYSGLTDTHTGPIVAKMIDIFSYDQPSEENTRSRLFKPGGALRIADWRNTMSAKLQYARLKDIWDYNRFIPNDNVYMKEDQQEPLEGAPEVYLQTVNMHPTQVQARKILYDEVYGKDLSSYDVDRINRMLKNLSDSVGDVPWRLQRSRAGNLYIAGYKGGSVTHPDYYSPYVGQFKQTEQPMSRAALNTIEKVKAAAKKMGIDIQELVKYAKDNNFDITGVNGVADAIRGIIAVAEGKEEVALTEEMVHLATAILEQTNPTMVTEMISKITRFKIYDRTLKEYRNNKSYQLPDGKPNIRKIKKEAVDKLIAELIVRNSEGTTEFPELLEETNRSIIRNWWNSILDRIRGMYKKTNLSIFEEVAGKVIEGDVGGTFADMENLTDPDGGVYLQLSDAQKKVQKNIMDTDKVLKKEESKEPVDPMFMDTEEANNWYNLLLPDGTIERVKKRVTDRVKKWYHERFPEKKFTPEEKAFNNFKRENGIKGHAFFEAIHKRYFNDDGTRKDRVLPRVRLKDSTDQEIYDKLEDYYVALIDRFSKNGKTPLVFSEVKVYDRKEKEAGTLDLLIVEEDGTANIIDWKFMVLGKDSNDVPWFKQGAFDIQLARYKDILLDNYGVKRISMNRAIPILMEVHKANPLKPDSKTVVTGINIGSVDPKKIQDIRLIPVSERTETTEKLFDEEPGFEDLDELIRKLYSLLEEVGKTDVGSEEERQYKNERLNTLRSAIRVAQGKLDITPIIQVIEVMKRQGENLINDYERLYKNRAPQDSDLEDPDLSEYSAALREYRAFAKVFGTVDDLIGHLVYNESMDEKAKTAAEKKEVEKRKVYLNNILKQASSIRNSEKKITALSGEFADKFIGQRNAVVGLLKPEPIIKGLWRTFRGVSELPSASLRLLHKIVTNARGKAMRVALGEADELMTIREKLVKRGGNLREIVKQIYQKDDEGKLANRLIYRYKKEFYDQIDANAAEDAQDKNWLLDNIDVAAYKAEAREKFNQRVAKIRKDHSDNEPLMNRLILEAQKELDITRADFTGWNNYIIKRHPLPKWESDEYKAIKADPELLELYDFISKINEKAKDVGYIHAKVATTFLPFVRKSMAESLTWDMDLSAILHWGDSLSMNADSVGYGHINSMTHELENSVPKYYTHDFSRREDGLHDYSDVSEDLFKNMLLYIQHMEKYTYLTEVEDQLLLVKTIEEFKGHLNTKPNSEVVFKNGKPEVLEGNEDNSRLFNEFLRGVFYEQQYPIDDSDLPLNISVKNAVKKAINKVAGRTVYEIDENPSAISLVKTMDAGNRAFQIKTLGLEIISGAVNAFGGDIQVATQAGSYFNVSEYFKNKVKLVGNRFAKDEEREMFVQLVDLFMPLKDDPAYERLQKAGMSALTRANFVDMLMVFMREPEQHLEKSIFLTLLQNTMVENGKLVNIRHFVKKKYKDRAGSAQQYIEAQKQIEAEVEELKKTRSIDSIKKLENGKLVIPGLDMTDNRELQRLTNLTRRISRNATGGISDSDRNRASMDIWLKSMMVFKNWIPKLISTRFAKFEKVADDFNVEIGEDGIAEGEKYDIGRIRLFVHVLSDGIFKGVENIHNILNLNEAGMIRLDKMYEDFAEKYRKTTGKDLEMSKADFIDLIRTNLSNEVKELAILLSLFGSMFALGFIAPDDDKDKAAKNRHRFYQRVINKFIGELSFFYNPVELQKILSGSMFPAIGLTTDIMRFTKHLQMELTGYDSSNPDLTVEEVEKKAQPIKNLAKMFPFTKSLITYGAIFDAEFAKEFDVTIQKESRR